MNIDLQLKGEICYGYLCNTFSSKTEDTDIKELGEKAMFSLLYTDVSEFKKKFLYLLVGIETNKEIFVDQLRAAADDSSLFLKLIIRIIDVYQLGPITEKEWRSWENIFKDHHYTDAVKRVEAFCHVFVA